MYKQISPAYIQQQRRPRRFFFICLVSRWDGCALLPPACTVSNSEPSRGECMDCSGKAPPPLSSVDLGVLITGRGRCDLVLTQRLRAAPAYIFLTSGVRSRLDYSKSVTRLSIPIHHPATTKGDDEQGSAAKSPLDTTTHQCIIVHMACNIGENKMPLFSNLYIGEIRDARLIKNYLKIPLLISIESVFE